MRRRLSYPRIDRLRTLISITYRSEIPWVYLSSIAQVLRNYEEHLCWFTGVRSHVTEIQVRNNAAISKEMFVLFCLFLIDRRDRLRALSAKYTTPHKYLELKLGKDDKITVLCKVCPDHPRLRW